MPHLYVLYLGISPAMNWRYYHLTRTTNGLIKASCDGIWKFFMDVWNKFPNEKVSKTFIQYWRVLGKVIKSKWGNEFTGSRGNMHYGIVNYFKAAENWLVSLNSIN